MNKTEENLILSFPTLTRETERGVQYKMVQWRNQKWEDGHFIQEIGITLQAFGARN